MTPTRPASIFSRLRLPALALALTACGVLVVLYAWRLPPFRTPVESTENAYVRGPVTVIAPKVDGYVDEVLVHDYEQVAAGQVLVRLDARNYAQRRAQAEAQLAVQQASLANTEQNQRIREAGLARARAQLAMAEAQRLTASAQLARAQADQRRSAALIADASVSQREFDQTQAALRQAQAAVSVADAQVLQAAAGIQVAAQELRAVAVQRQSLAAAVQGAHAGVQLGAIDLDNTQIRAPVAGAVGEVGVKQGQYVTPGAQLLALVPHQVWVIANFKEAQTARMRVGQPARLRVDALADATLAGVVESISPATGAEFSVIKPDNATGNFTKIPQRLPVRIAVDAADPLAARLRPGMSVVAEVDTAGAR